jgi:hypothetical protein
MRVGYLLFDYDSLEENIDILGDVNYIFLRI